MELIFDFLLLLLLYILSKEDSPTISLNIT